MSDFPWEKVKDYDEIIYEKYDGIAKITINRPERRNAFTPKTNVEPVRRVFPCARRPGSGRYHPYRR